MVRTLILLLAVTSAQAELQLTPTISEYQLDGVKFKLLAFPDGGRHATYQPPTGWEYFGSANKLTLHPLGKTQAEATITRVGSAQPVTLNDESCRRLAEESLATIPKGSSGATVISQEKNPLKISGNDTFQVVLRYNLLGQIFQRSILFLNREHDQMRFQLVARDNDFRGLQQSFQSSLCSWANL